MAASDDYRQLRPFDSVAKFVDNQEICSGLTYGESVKDRQTLALEMQTRTLEIVSKVAFLDGVFQIDRHNANGFFSYREPGKPPISGKIDITEVYPDKNAQEIGEAVMRVRKLKADALTYASAVYAKNSDAKHMESQVLRANPGFSQATYGIAINEGFVILR